MESDATQSAWFYQAWAWAEAHKKQVLGGAVAVVVAGLAAGLYVWQQNQKQVAANEALSHVTMGGFVSGNQEPAPEALLKIAADHPNTDAAGRALLLAAGELFAAGKFADAQTQFERFLRDYRDTPFAGQALYGIAVCQESQGKTAEAMAGYNNIISRRASDSVVPQAKLSLARLYESQNKLDEARNLYLELARGGTSYGQESGMRYEQLITQHPELVQTNRPSVAMPAPVDLKK
jgi:tetratricopeptide (TPR) repeat protein